MRTKRFAVLLLLFLAFPSLVHAQLSIKLFPSVPFPPLGTRLAGTTASFNFSVYLECNGFNSNDFDDQVTLEAQLPFSQPITLVGSPNFTLDQSSTQILQFNMLILGGGFHSGQIGLSVTSHTGGDNSCRYGPDDSAPGPPNPPAPFQYEYNGSAVGIHDYARIESSDRVISPAAGSLSPSCGPRLQGYCPPRYATDFIQAEGSHAYEVSDSWSGYLVGRTGPFPLQLKGAGEEVEIPGPILLPANEQWLRDSNGNAMGLVQAQVKDSDGFVHPAKFLIGVQLPPGKPTLSLKDTGSTATLSYVADGAKTFKIYYGRTSGSYNGTGLTGGPSPISVGAQTSYTFTGLGIFRTYYMAVKGFNDQGESVYSNEVVVHPRPIFDLATEFRAPLYLVAGCLFPTDNLVLWLPLDETSGVSAANMSVFSSQVGTINGSPTSAPGRVSGSRCFNGSSDYVEVASYPEINFGVHDFSLETWVKPSSSDSVRVLIDKRDEFSPAYGVVGYSFFLYNGRLGLQLADGFYDNYISDITVPTDGNWHHVAVTVRRSSATGGQFYLDGTPVGKTFDPTRHPGALAATNPLRIGSRSSSVTGLFQGCLDEVQAFEQALSPDEVLSHFQASSSGTCK